MASFADGSDLLVHDCSFPDGTDVSNHPNPPRNWGVARGHRYRHAAALAPVPAHRGREREMAQSVRDAGFDGDVEVASDGLRVAIAERSGSAGDGSAAGAGEANEADEADEADETDEADEAAEADGT